MSSPARLSDLASVLNELQMDSPATISKGGDAGVSSPAGSSFTNISHTDLKSDSCTIIPSGGESPLDSKSIVHSATFVQGSSTKKYRIWVAPDSGDLCYQFIGQGSTFCIQSKCSIKHKNTERVSVPPGMAFVLKSPISAFREPSINVDVIGERLLAKWSGDLCTLDEWSARFLLVEQELDSPNLRDPGEKISEGDILAKEEETMNALSFKTPAKRRKISENQLVVDRPEFFSLFPADEPFIETSSSPEQTLSNAITKMSLLAKAVEVSYAQQQRDMQLMVDGLRKFDLKFLENDNLLGSRPPTLAIKYNAPNMWSTLGLLAEEIDNSDLKPQIHQLESSVQHLATQHNDPEPLIKQYFDPLQKELSTLNTFVINASRTLNSKIINVSSSPAHSAVDIKQFEERDKLIMEKMSVLEDEITTLKAAHDSSAIRFGKLGFRTSAEANLWVEVHHPGQDFGLLMDFHLIMEHLNVQMTGQKLMSNFEKIHKMKLESNNQALAISSFETRIPRFFSSEGSFYVKKDESYFSGIKCWDDWDRPNDGHRDRLLQELHLFKVGHMDTLENKLQSLSPYYNLCVLALTESVSWVEGLAKFIDDTYNEYSRCRYGSMKAFHITTRLAKSLIEKVAKPRNAVQNSFRISNPSDISKAITYASLKSLDIMMEISSVGFKHSPIITAELSKFLALNSNFDVVDKMQAKFTSIESDQTSLKKEVKQASSAAHTASNKYDSLVKSVLEDLKRRVKAIEGKM